MTQPSSPESAADIVERLRGLANLDEYSNSHYDKLHYPLLREAAAEIVRLRRPAKCMPFLCPRCGARGTTDGTASTVTSTECEGR